MTRKPRTPKPWTYETVSAKIGVSRSMVARYFLGEKYPSLGVLRTVERVYGWPLIEQIDCIPNQGHDMRYSEQFRWWVEQSVQGEEP